MSAIDFEMDISRETDPHGDRVRLSLRGRYRAYRMY
jgi:cyanate lyase